VVRAGEKAQIMAVRGITKEEGKMLYMSEEDSVARIDLSGEFNRNNIVSIKQGILNRINPSIKAVEFHMENVHEMDAPAMAMMVIIVKHLLTKGRGRNNFPICTSHL